MNQNQAWIDQYENELGTRESVSGYGSELQNTEEIRQALPHIISKYSIRSIVDVPCGDWNWMQKVELDVNYIGLDIVPDMVVANNKAYGNYHIKFKVHDIVEVVPPKADLVICRDLLFHLPQAQCLKVLANIRESGARYFLSTTFPYIDNSDVIADSCIRWRKINLCRAPYSLPAPIYTIQENDSDACQSRTMGLFVLGE